MEFKRIAVDTSKSVFTLHGVDEHGRPILRQDLTRARFETFLGKTSPTEVVLEAWFKAGLHMELGEAGLTLPGWTMAP